jgi:putative membrane-bound dehydrogenase-like protein
MLRACQKLVVLLCLAGVAWSVPVDSGSPPAGRAFHFAGGRMKSSVKLGENFSVAIWLWNALPADARPVTGYAFSRGVDGDNRHGEHLGIGGTHQTEAQGRLILFNGNAADQLLIGKTRLALKAWHHVVLVREGVKVRVHLDGKPVPDLEGELPVVIKSDDVFIGGRADNFANWEGKLDEVAIFERALTGSEASQLYQASKMTPPSAVLAPEFPPVSPEESLKKIHVPDGFKVELVACEPDVIDPVAIDWDLAGRLWVVEMADYPSGMDGKEKPGGRVRVLEDSDGDGRYEKSALFADNLSFPTGLLTWRDGVIVTAAPDVLFLKDTNSDGRADSTEKLISGLMEGNQQLRANGLRWGLDNRVYCAAGGHHGGHGSNTVLRSHRDKQDVKVGSRDFSFDPDTGNVRPESGPSQFGRNRDDAGHWFGTQNSRALWHYVLPDHYLQRNPHVPAPDPTHLLVTPLNAPVYPMSPPEKRFHSFENANHYTSACSGMIYRDELLFPRRDNELDAFTCEPFHNLVQHNVLVEDGVTWKAKRAPGEEKHDFFASEDRWCRPVMTRTGPDGALWVVDMYRYMIEHPAWLPENGRAELLPHYRLGDDKGRIYRVFCTDKPPRKVQPMDKLRPAELVKAMDSPNEWRRDKAQMALEARRAPDNDPENGPVHDAAWELLKSNNPLARIQAIWFITSLTWHAPASEVLSDPDPRVRENAIKAEESEPEPGFLSLANDPSPKVRLQFALSSGNWSFMDVQRSEKWALELGRGLAAIAIRDYTDPWMRAAVMSSAVPHCRALCEAIAAEGGAAFAAYADGLIGVALGLNDRTSLAALLQPLLAPADGRYTAGQFSALSRVLDTLRKRNLDFFTLKSSNDDDLSKELRGIVELWVCASEAARDDTALPADRAAAAGLAVRLESDDSKTRQHVASWLGPENNSDLQRAAVRILAESGEASVPDTLLAGFASLAPATQVAAVEALLGREPWAIGLLNKLQTGTVIPLDATQRARLSQHSSKKVRDLAASVLKQGSARKEVLEQFRPALLLKGDAARGKVVFCTRCIACHKVDGAGIDIGPDLKSVVNHPPEKILTNIIDPSLDVQPGFFAFQARLKDGSELYGLVTSETGNSVTFKLTDGNSKLVLRSDLADFKSTGQSLMPAGLETGMTPQEMADLIAWLKYP